MAVVVINVATVVDSVLVVVNVVVLVVIRNKMYDFSISDFLV